MALNPFAWMFADEEGRSIVEAVRGGHAGAGVRIGLSVSAAVVCVAGAMLVLGMLEASGGRARDHHIGIAVAGAALLWGGSLVALWWGYPRFRSLIRAIVSIVAVWAVALPAAFGIAEAIPRAEFLVASVILGAAGATLAFIVIGAAHAATGRRIVSRLGEIVVRCPRCRYSLVGLESTTCPECGTRFTVDEIIRGQGYDDRRILDATASAVDEHRAALPASEGDDQERAPALGVG